MNLMTYALLKKEISKSLTKGITVTKVEIKDTQLIFYFSDGTKSIAGKIPAVDLETLDNLRNEILSEIGKTQSDIEKLKDTFITTEGGVITGPLTLLAEPTDDFHAITKSYLENYTDEKLSSIPNFVVSEETKEGFPKTGEINIIYKAEKEKKLYQWNPDISDYEVLNKASISDIENIKIINGGNSNARN